MHSVSSMQEATRASNKAFQITLTLQQAKPPPQARSHLPESISQLCALPCASQRWHRRAGRERRTMARTHRAGIGWECPLCARAPAVQLGTDTAGYRQNAARGLCARAQQGDHTCAMHPRTTTCTCHVHRTVRQQTISTARCQWMCDISICKGRHLAHFSMWLCASQGPPHAHCLIHMEKT